MGTIYAQYCKCFLVCTYACWFNSRLGKLHAGRIFSRAPHQQHWALCVQVVQWDSFYWICTFHPNVYIYPRIFNTSLQMGTYHIIYMNALQLGPTFFFCHQIILLLFHSGWNWSSWNQLKAQILFESIELCEPIFQINSTTTAAQINRKTKWRLSFWIRTFLKVDQVNKQTRGE